MFLRSIGGGTPAPIVPYEILTDGVYQNNCTGSGFGAGSGYLSVPSTASCSITIPEYLRGYTKLQVESETTNATGSDTLQATCAGHSNKAATGAGKKTFIVDLAASDVFNTIEFAVVDIQGSIAQKLYNVTLIP